MIYNSIKYKKGDINQQLYIKYLIKLNNKEEYK